MGNSALFPKPLLFCNSNQLYDGKFKLFRYHQMKFEVFFQNWENFDREESENCDACEYADNLKLKHKLVESILQRPYINSKKIFRKKSETPSIK